jgi:predicted AlkP superfamily phosphohydrolase/phosphomutase
MLAILQFDAAALPLVGRMLADGRLPTLAGLRRRGTWTPIDGKATFLQSSTYPTLCTGIDVREHGIYSAVPWSASAQRACSMLSLPRPRTIWERLTESGRRALIIDPYLAFAPREMAGIYISGLHFEDRMVMQHRSVPRDQHRALTRRYGRPPRLDDVYGVRKVASLLEWRDQLIAAPDRIAGAVIDLLSRHSFELLWLNFAVAHKAGHHLWDPASVVNEPLDGETERGLRDGLAGVYQAIDTAMARVLDALPNDSDVIVFSPTGMGPNTSRGDFLPDMLDLVLSGGTGQSQPREARRSSIWSLRSRIPANWRSSIARALPDRVAADLMTRLYARADWSRTRAIAIPGENKGYVRLNLKGREREGIVAPAAVDELTDSIVQGLMTFRDPDGSPSITTVERMRDMTEGQPYAGRLPDLVVFWGDRPAAKLDRVTSSRFGEVLRRGIGSGRSGNHTDDAWAIVLPGRSRVSSLGRAARITDIGATACRLLGADQSGLSGTSMLEVA